MIGYDYTKGVKLNSVTFLNLYFLHVAQLKFKYSFDGMGNKWEKGKILSNFL